MLHIYLITDDYCVGLRLLSCCCYDIWNPEEKDSACLVRNHTNRCIKDVQSKTHTDTCIRFITWDKRGIIILVTAFMKTYWVIRGHYKIASSQVANLITSLQKAMTDWTVFSPTLCQNTFPIRHCRRGLDLSFRISWIVSVNISFWRSMEMLGWRKRLHKHIQMPWEML